MLITLGKLPHGVLGVLLEYGKGHGVKDVSLGSAP
jgi:hypothetical protein